ncbi:hypothetical protein AB0D91_23815 [Streptomyces canus]|uniref:hypothetical protein n=1 Tax=Streptomyces canus TaxID=58343 RepID=UPI00340CBC0D
MRPAWRREGAASGHDVQQSVHAVDEEFDGPRVDGPGDEAPVGTHGEVGGGPLQG